MLAAEREQLSGQSRGALARLTDAPAAFGQLLPGHPFIAQQFGVPLDDGEDVVEFMGYAGGEPTDCFHLLRLAQLRFQPQLHGHILDDQQHARAAIEWDGFGPQHDFAGRTIAGAQRASVVVQMPTRG